MLSVEVLGDFMWFRQGTLIWSPQFIHLDREGPYIQLRFGAQDGYPSVRFGTREGTFQVKTRPCP